MADEYQRTKRNPQPVTRHPLFPAVLALWFGALFGLGSLAIRTTLMEDVIVASGIDLIVPAATPPLGMTFRILLALALTSLGSLIGYALGSRLGRPESEPVQRRRATLAVKEPPKPRRADRFTAQTEAPPRPLSAFEDLDREDRIEPTVAAPALGSRRRALAMAEPEGPDYARMQAPLPGSDYDAPAVPDQESDVFDLSDALTEDHREEAEVPSDEPLAPALQPTLPVKALGPVEIDPASAKYEAEPVPHPVASDDSGADHEADDRNLPPRNSGQRFAAPEPAPEPQADIPPRADSHQVAAPMPETIEPQSASAVAKPAAPLWSAPAASAGYDSAAHRLRSAPLDSLSQIELMERLALSIQDRRSTAKGAQSVPASAPRDIPRFGFEPRVRVEIDLPKAPAREPATAAPPAPAATGTAIPAAMRPIDLSVDTDDLADDDTAPVLPRFPFAGPQAQPAPVEMATTGPTGTAEPEEEAGEPVVDDSFPSLLAQGRPVARQPLVRIEEPVDEDAEIEPVVVFPGHGSRPFAPPAAPVPEPAASLPPLPPGTRPFDAPSPSASAPVAAQAAPAAPESAAASRQDPEETERALRAALATLQRMSGAA